MYIYNYRSIPVYHCILYSGIIVYIARNTQVLIRNLTTLRGLTITPVDLGILIILSGVKITPFYLFLVVKSG